jgi:hypothetical protein
VSFTYVLRPVPESAKDLGEIARRGLPILSKQLTQESGSMSVRR